MGLYMRTLKEKAAFQVIHEIAHYSCWSQHHHNIFLSTQAIMLASSWGNILYIKVLFSFVCCLYGPSILYWCFTWVSVKIQVTDFSVCL